MAEPVKLPAKLATIDEAIEYLQVDRRTIRRWISEGILIAYRIGPRLIRIDLDSAKVVRVGGGAQ